MVVGPTDHWLFFTVSARRRRAYRRLALCCDDWTEPKQVGQGIMVHGPRLILRRVNYWSATICLFNIAMENPLYMEVFMGKSSLNGPFSMANVKLPEGIILSQVGDV